MPKSKPGDAPVETNTFSENNGKEQRDGTQPQSKATEAGEYGELIGQAKAWIEDNQTTAMLSGFGFGVFIGVLLRR